MEERREAKRGSKSDRYGDKDRIQWEQRQRREGKREIRYCYECGEQGHIGVNCPYTWTNCIDEEDDQISSREVDLEGRSQKNLRVWRRLTMRDNGVGPNGTESPGGESGRIKGQHSTSLQKTTEKVRRLGH